MELYIAANVPKNISELRYELAPPQAISHDRWDEIRQIRQIYYDHVFRRRTYDEIQNYVNSTSVDSWNDPNNSESLLGRFARAQVIAAYDRGDEIVAFGYCADNASSNKPGLFGSAEELAKLHVPMKSFLNRRYKWIREIVHDYEDRPNLVTALGASLLSISSPGQPVVQYLYEEELAQRHVLTHWGFGVDADSTQAIKPFGDEAASPLQYRYLLKRASDANCHMKQNCSDDILAAIDYVVADISS